MATYVNRNGKVRAVVRIKGHTATQTFDTKAAAKAWALAEELRLKSRVINAGGMTLGDILAKYRTDVVDKKEYKVDSLHYKSMARRFSHVELKDMNYQWWLDAAAAWSKIKPGSRLRYFVKIKSALTAAKDLWRVQWDTAAFKEAMGAMSRQGIIGEGGSRDRRVTDDEASAIKAAAGEFDYPKAMADIIDFALITGMRRGEICRITWADFDAKTKMQWVRDRKDPRKKKGNDQEVPLLNNAAEIIRRQPRTPGEPRIFPFRGKYVGKYFSNMAEAAGVKGVCFHDLRHEAISRLFELGYSIPEVCLVSGHKNWKTLKKYTHLKAIHLHAGPIAAQRQAA